MGNFIVNRPFIYVAGAVITSAQNNSNETTIYGGHNASMHATTGHTHTGSVGDAPILGSSSFNLSAINQNVHLLTGHSFISDDFIPGSVLFAGNSKEISQDNPAIFWDIPNKRLGLGTLFPDERLHVDGNMSVGPGYTGSPGDPAFIELGPNQTGNRNAYIDFHGDDTYVDYGLRIIREDQGANANSNFLHHGTGALSFDVIEAGSVVFYTTNIERARILATGEVGIGTAIPGSLLEVSGGVIHANNNNAICVKIGDDSTLNDINDVNTLGINGVTNTDRANIKLGTAGPKITGENNGRMQISGELVLPDTDPPTANYLNRNSGIKVWVEVNSNGSSSNSYNVSATSKSTTGTYTVTFDTDFSSAIIGGGAITDDAATTPSYIAIWSALSVSSIGLQVTDASTNGADRPFIAMFAGDQ